MIGLKKTKANLLMLATGAAGYSTLELLWRGRTHWSMMLAGGFCFLSFGRLGRVKKSKNVFFRFAAGSAVVTAVELVFGLIFNVALKKKVWDYSSLPHNFLGQICPQFSFAWGLLGIPCIPIAQKLYNRLLK